MSEATAIRGRKTQQSVDAGAASAGDLPSNAAPTLWGLSVCEVHDAFWRARGVQCVRPGDECTLDRSADLFLLLEPGQLALFDLRELLDRLIWTGALLMRLRIARDDDSAYRELIVSNAGLVRRIERRYGPDHRRSGRVFLTKSPKLADQWRRSASSRAARRAVRADVPRMRIDTVRAGGWTGSTLVGGQSGAAEQSRALEEIVGRWKNPNRAIEGIEQVPGSKGVWRLKGEDGRRIGPAVVAPVWLGRGRPLDDEHFLIGPVACQDVAPAAQGGAAEAPRARVRSIFEIVTGEAPKRPRDGRDQGSAYLFFKRAFDIAVSSAVLVLLAPVFAIVAVAIILDSGRPVFFGHRRQTRGGAEFNCLKFRTMRQNAEHMVVNVADQNLCDGPQVFIPDDPRVTRVGRILRATNLDELPQLVNVLMGHMSIVGPRPSPERENRCCPAWRETRLSVRPGITGLWQVSRTRAAGEDFQEWIRYDIEYVRTASFWVDLMICFQTVRVVLFGRKS